MHIDIVLKVGGGLLAGDGCLDSVLAEIGCATSRRSIVIVPGGGPFADAVRQVDSRVRLSDDAAHWMAILAMDQYAELVASRLPRSALVWTTNQIEDALRAGCIPVLAPHRWLRDLDPLPHSWDVTSDSIAAWIAGTLGACRLVLIKPAGVTGEAAVDSSFSTVLPEGMSVAIVPADDLPALRTALEGCR